MKDIQVARGLGWFGIGLGIGEIMAPRWLGEKTGIGPRKMLLRTLGAREIASGIAILRQRKPGPGLQARVAGDLIDLAVLARAAKRSFFRKRIAMAAIAVLGVTALDFIYSQRL